ncbi:MAG: DUF3795 domain-containing protein [Candidatus Sabulitectum sp.]|nr:DUF3795 domain-containing protein [Candidatus Sabulitectum sp.]
MKIAVCGIACEKCPRRLTGTCPYGEAGCVPKKDDICKISSCAAYGGIDFCFECTEFPCELTRLGPVKYEYCKYISS